jgi:outer membrane protein OmpA-like peptidoglycan-associated protein
VTASGIAITGTDAANYTHNTSTTTTANITARALTVTISADNKVYDGNTTASVVYTDDRVSGDVFTVTGTSTFSSKTVGTTKTVTATGITLSGTDATNYTGNTTATTTADISLRSLAVTITASSKTYDGTDTATVTYQDNRINGDLFTVTGTPTFNNKNVGNTKNVTANNIALTGTDAANYTQNITAVTNANITRRPLVVVVTAGNKTYDATTVAPVTYTDDRLAGDSFTISSSAFFVDEELGLNKLVTITNISLSGADADNYQPNTSSTSSANITVREITAHIQSQAGNTPLSDSTPSVQLGLLVPNIDTTVTFTRTGYSSVVCTFTPQNVSDTCTSPALADGTWSYRGRQLIAGLMVAASEPSTITIDTTAPLATRPVAFQSNSDTGTNTSDGVTNDSTPTVVISQASPTDSVVVTATSTSQVVQCSFTATASAQTCVLPTLSDGSWTITAVITDQANNSSASTPPFVAMIDTIAPTPSAAPFNAQDNGATTSLVATPRISVSGVASGEIVTINGLSSKSETSSCSFIASPTLNFCEMSSMASGTWTLTSVASDLAGNSAAVSAPTQIIISAGLAPMTVAKSSLTPQPTTNRRENVVSVKFGNTAALAGVQSVSFIVHDKSGKVVRRTTLKMNPGDTGARIVIPRSLKGARVRVVTTNQCGVSEGAPRGFNVRPGSTAITVDQKTNVPVLAGQIVLPQIDFAASEIALDAKDKVQLDQVIKAMKGKCGTLLVSGFSRHNKTDSNRYLQNLADFRAQAVANYLSGKNLNMWINYQGFIIKSNDKSAGANRRVALYWNPS